MAEDKNQSGPAGSRQDRPHAEDGWQEGGRNDERPFDQAEADARAERYRGRHRRS